MPNTNTHSKSNSKICSHSHSHTKFQANMIKVDEMHTMSNPHWKCSSQQNEGYTLCSTTHCAVHTVQYTLCSTHYTTTTSTYGNPYSVWRVVIVIILITRAKCLGLVRVELQRKYLLAITVRPLLSAVFEVKS